MHFRVFAQFQLPASIQEIFDNFENLKNVGNVKNVGKVENFGIFENFENFLRIRKLSRMFKIFSIEMLISSQKIWGAPWETKLFPALCD